MEKLVLVPYEKYQRQNNGEENAKPAHRRERTVLKKKGPPGERDKPSAATRYTIKDWISF